MADEYNGPERRQYEQSACLMHSGHERWMADNTSRIDALQEIKPIGLSIFKWTVGFIISIFLSLFSISLYASLDAKQSLHEINIKQEKVIYKLEDLSQDVAEIKLLSTEEIDKLHRKLNMQQNR